MKSIIFITTIILSQNLTGQLVNDISSVLKTKNYETFLNYVSSFENNKSIKAYNMFASTFTQNYEQRIYEFQKSIPHKDDPNTFTVDIYRVKLLINGKSIFYFSLSAVKNKKVNDNWEAYDGIITEYKNVEQYKELETAFQNAFDAPLIKSELFNNSMVYGRECGYVGEDPKEAKDLDSLVTIRDRVGLIKWMQSSIVEKQIYGLEGLHTLWLQGAILTSQEIKIIKNIMTKNGSIHTCSGCIGIAQKIEYVTRDFKFFGQFKPRPPSY